MVVEGKTLSVTPSGVVSRVPVGGDRSEFIKERVYLQQTLAGMLGRGGLVMPTCRGAAQIRGEWVDGARPAS